MRTRFNILAACLLLVLYMLRPSLAMAQQQDIDGFLRKYESASEKLDNAYKNVSITGTISFTYWRDAQQFTRTDELQMVRNETMAREFRKTTASDDAEWNVGSITISGGTNTLSYFCSKQPEDKDFSFSSFGPDPRYMPMLPFNFKPCFAVTHMLESHLTEWLKGKKVESIALTTFDQKPALEIVYEFVFLKHIEQDHAYIDPVTYAVMGWNLPRQTAILKGSVHYSSVNSEGIPLISSIDTSQENTAVPNTLIKYSYKINDVTFKVISAEQFSPSALTQFGVTDIPVYIPDDATTLPTDSTNAHDADPKSATTSPVSPELPQLPVSQLTKTNEQSGSVFTWFYIVGIVICLAFGAFMFFKSRAVKK